MTAVARVVNGVYALRRKVDSEEVFVRRTLHGHFAKGGRLLDVGCGFSRFHEIIRECGLDYVGVDINPDTVAENRRRGRAVFLAPDLPPGAADGYDALLLSHIIEHFEPLPLVGFLNPYLARLNAGGIVIILTPLMHRGFFDDFDHVRPYPPAAIRQLFCRTSAQTQEFGLAGQYIELGLWLKRDSLWHTHRRGRWAHLFAVPLVLASTLSGGVFGRLTGYGMILRKTGA